MFYHRDGEIHTNSQFVDALNKLITDNAQQIKRPINTKETVFSVVDFTPQTHINNGNSNRNITHRKRK
jgi:hypothetical protein